MKLKALHLASMAGIDVYSAYGVIDNPIERFAKLIIEECAVECEKQEQRFSSWVDEASGAASCAIVLRNLMED